MNARACAAGRGAAWLGAALVAGASLGAWLAWPDAQPLQSVTVLPAKAQAQAQPAVTAASGASAPKVMQAAASTPGPIASEPLPAHWSMADAKTRGDDRAPPIVRSRAAALPVLPPLGDHAAYARREQEADRRWKQDYAKAVDAELPEMEKLIARGQREGVPAEAVEKMKRKMAALREARQQLSQELGASAPPLPPGGPAVPAP